MKQSEFFSSLLPLARKAGEAFRINPVVILAQAAIESGWGQSDLASEHHNYFGLRPLQRLVERRKHRVGRPFPPFPYLRQSRRLVHGLRPPDPFGLPVRRRRQRRPESLRPQDRLQQIHQRSQRRQPCRLSSVVGQGLQKNQ